MATMTDPIGVIISGLIIICCVSAFKRYWKVRNTGGCMWVMVVFFLCLSVILESLKI
jgi:hypothetical protein